MCLNKIIYNARIRIDSIYGIRYAEHNFPENMRTDHTPHINGYNSGCAIEILIIFEGDTTEASQFSYSSCNMPVADVQMSYVSKPAVRSCASMCTHTHCDLT